MHKGCQCNFDYSYIVLVSLSDDNFVFVFDDLVGVPIHEIICKNNLLALNIASTIGNIYIIFIGLLILA